MTPFAIALLVGLAACAVRVGVIAWRVSRGALPWSRLLLPAIVLLLVAGLVWGGEDITWHARLGVVVALEVAFVAVTVRELRRHATDDAPPEARIANALASLVPTKLARLAAFELVIFGSALRFIAGGWRRPLPAGFAYHRESGLRMFLPLLPLLVVGDVLLLELVILPRTSAWVRVVVHALAVYGVIWMIGLYATMRLRPHQLVGRRLLLHRGMLRRLELDTVGITSIGPLPAFSDDWKKLAYCKGAIRMDVPGPPVLELQLSSPVQPMGVLGLGRASSRVLLAVDDPTALEGAIKNAIDSEGPIEAYPRHGR